MGLYVVPIENKENEKKNQKCTKTNICSFSFEKARKTMWTD